MPPARRVKDGVHQPALARPLDLENVCHPACSLQTCSHFLKGVNGQFQGGYQYKDSPVHRIVKHAFIQAGDVVDGTGKVARWTAQS